MYMYIHVHMYICTFGSNCSFRDPLEVLQHVPDT